MGIYNNTYIGPYIVIKPTVEEIVITEYFDPENGKKMKTRFNANTGVEGVKKTRIEKIEKSISLYNIEVDGFCEDEFVRPEYVGQPNTWICNNSDFSPSLDTDDVFNFDLTNFDLSILYSNFLTHYKEYLNKLKEKAIDFEISYGIVNYSH